MHRLVRRLSSATPGQFRVTSEGSLRRVVIDHPARRNALTLDMYRQLPRIAADANGGRVALLEGVGEHFSAGSDISEFATLRADSYQAEEWDTVEVKAAEALRDLDIPLVALVRGNCYGSALNLMLMADVRVAADDATFCVPPAKLGLGYPRHLLEPLVDTVGRSAASELILTARVIDASEEAARPRAPRRRGERGCRSRRGRRGGDRFISTSGPARGEGDDARAPRQGRALHGGREVSGMLRF